MSTLDETSVSLKQTEYFTTGGRMHGKSAQAAVALATAAAMTEGPTISGDIPTTYRQTYSPVSHRNPGETQAINKRRKANKLARKARKRNRK